uniref:Interferon alpha-inducible protein 27-like protein 2A n=1 Tax=Erpetoichthys calabaricus TaxID=27687 RepID=A0A8C4S6H2_ERPCA
MHQKTIAIFFIILISTFQGEGKSSSEEEDGSLFNYALLAGGAVAGMLAVPALLGAAGFTSAGIAAGSVGAKLMSASAIANGGGVAAGSLVATLQSAGKRWSGTPGRTGRGTTPPPDHERAAALVGMGTTGTEHGSSTL